MSSSVLLGAYAIGVWWVMLAAWLWPDSGLAVYGAPVAMLVGGYAGWRFHTVGRHA